MLRRISVVTYSILSVRHPFCPWYDSVPTPQ